MADKNVFRPADPVGVVARLMIPEIHPHLSGVDIRYVFRTKGQRSGGRDVLGKTSKLGGLSAYLANGEDYPFSVEEGMPSFIVVEVAEGIWNNLGDKSKQALVDHLLSYIRLEEGGELSIMQPDVQEFSSVIERRGLWRKEVKDFAAVIAALQPSLELVETIQPSNPPAAANGGSGATSRPKRNRSKKTAASG
jgi:hypothetical protein